jgi:hypothetical protein
MTTLRIVPDTDPSNPRTDSDNFCLMACAHGRYNLGDSRAIEILAGKLDVSARDYSLLELINLAYKADLIFTSKPLYLYDHSGITMATTPFSCKWDSGQVGEILVFKADIKSEFGVKRMGKKIKEKMLEVAERHIDSEVAAYDAYLTGDIYTLEILDDEGEVEESICGFIGYDVDKNGMAGCIDQSMIEALKACEVIYS